MRGRICHECRSRLPPPTFQSTSLMDAWVQAGGWGTLALYFLSWGAALTHHSQALPHWLDHQGLRVGWALHTVVLGLMLPLLSIWPASLAEDLLSVVAWGCVTLVLTIPQRLKALLNLVVVRVFAILLLGIAVVLSGSEIPGLQLLEHEHWLYHALLSLHIIGFVAGYILFGWACLASALFLYEERQLKAKLMQPALKHLPALGTLDRISTHAIRLGFLMLTLGLVLGAVLGDGFSAGAVSGRLSFSVAIWFVYAVLLTHRQLQPPPGRWTAVWPILGFLCFLTALVMEIYHLSLPDIPE